MYMSNTVEGAMRKFVQRDEVWPEYDLADGYSVGGYAVELSPEFWAEYLRVSREWQTLQNALREMYEEQRAHGG